MIDGAGMAVSTTTRWRTASASKVVVRGAGFLLNNEMTDFNLTPGVTTRKGQIGTEPNQIAPGKRMLSSMTPAIVVKDGKPVLVTGSPGGRTIINTVLWVVLNVLEFGMPMREAVDAPAPASAVVPRPDRDGGEAGGEVSRGGGGTGETRAQGVEGPHAGGCAFDLAGTEDGEVRGRDGPTASEPAGAVRKREPRKIRKTRKKTEELFRERLAWRRLVRAFDVTGVFFVIATAETIWRVPAYLPYLQPPLTDAVVASAEKEIGYRLPTEYLNLLKKQNGGYIRFSLPEIVHDSIAGIGPHFPSLTGFDWDDCQEHVSYPLQGLVPFDGDGHWHLCLDYRENAGTPVVTLANIACDQQTRIADSFADYLALLQIDVGDEFVLEGVSDIETVKSALCLSLSIAFDPPDTWAHGYATHRARLGTPNHPEWVWISPNTVPRGFVRSDDPRYLDLKDLMPGQAPRFPELPGGSYILSATAGVRSKVIDACARSRMIVRPLREYVKGI